MKVSKYVERSIEYYTIDGEWRLYVRSIHKSDSIICLEAPKEKLFCELNGDIWEEKYTEPKFLANGT